MSESEFETGIVRSISADRAVVELVPGEVCESCSARIICRPGKSGRHEMSVLNPIDAQPGETVELAETGNLLLILSLMQYGIPLLGLLCGIFIIYVINPEVPGIHAELLMTAGGLVGLLLGGWLVWFGLRHLAGRIDNVFRIAAVRSGRH